MTYSAVLKGQGCASKKKKSVTKDTAAMVPCPPKKKFLADVANAGGMAAAMGVASDVRKGLPLGKS